VADWLDEGLSGRTVKTVEANRDSLRPLLAVTGGIPLKDLTVHARLAGHASSRTTEVIYRREPRPVITTGAEVMDQIFRSRQARADDAGRR
jgi:hypothetical protein